MKIPEPKPGQTQCFTDTAGRSWLVAVEVPDLRRIVQVTGIDLTRLLDPEFPHSDLFTNWEKLVNVLWAAVQPQLESFGVSARDFALSLNADVLDDATAALVIGLVEFYPFAQRPLIRRAWNLASHRQMFGRSLTSA